MNNSDCPTVSVDSSNKLFWEVKLLPDQLTGNYISSSGEVGGATADCLTAEEQLFINLEFILLGQILK